MDVTVHPEVPPVDHRDTKYRSTAPDEAWVPGWARAVRGLGTGLLVLFVTGALALGTAVAFLPAVANGSTMKVLSGSMEGTFSKGDVVVSRPVEAGSIGPGDVITFRAHSSDSRATRTVTHRVVRVVPGPAGPEFVTRGDANPVDDLGTTKASDVQGEMWYHVPRVGDLRDALFAPAGMFCGAGVLLLLVGGHLLLPRGRGRRDPREQP